MGENPEKMAASWVVRGLVASRKFQVRRNGLWVVRLVMSDIQF